MICGVLGFTGHYDVTLKNKVTGQRWANWLDDNVGILICGLVSFTGPEWCYFEELRLPDRGRRTGYVRSLLEHKRMDGTSEKASVHGARLVISMGLGAQESGTHFIPCYQCTWVMSYKVTGQNFFLLLSPTGGQVSHGLNRYLPRWGSKLR